MAEQERRQGTEPFRDEAERGGQALGGAPRPDAEPAGIRGETGADYRTGYSGYEDDRGGFVDDGHGGPRSDGHVPDKAGHGSGYGAFGTQDKSGRDDASEQGGT
jgi:hypothetical protein